MRRIVLAGFVAAISTTACHRQVELGSRPHLLGKLADIDLGMSEREMISLVPEIADTADAEPSAIEYSARFDRDKHLESVVARVAQPIDALLAAWGPGIPGSYASGPARIYDDPAKGIRFVVRLDSNAPTGNSFTVIAMPLRPLAAILDAGADTKMFGIDVLGNTLEVARGQLDKQGVATRLWSIEGDLAKYFHTDRYDALGHSSTEFGDWSFQLSADKDNHVITRIELDIEDHGHDDEALLALFARKWGEPTRDDLTLSYPVKDHKIRVTLGYKVELVIAELSHDD